MSNQAAFAEALLLNQSPTITMYVIDASDLGGETLRLYAGTDPDGSSILWQGVVYSQYPIEARGFEIRSQGTLPTPALALANIFGTISALCIAFRDLVGAKVIRKRTFAKFLDGSPDADPTAHFPDDVYYIERKSEETNLSVSFELASPMDVDDVVIPKRRIIANLCQWRYRGAECGYAAPKCVADNLDNTITLPQTYRGAYSIYTQYVYQDVVFILAKGIRRYFKARNVVQGTGEAYSPPNTTYWEADECSKHILGCQKRFGKGNLPFGGFPAVARLPIN